MGVALATKVTTTAPGDITSQNINNFTTTGIYQAFMNANVSNGITNAWGILMVIHEHPAVTEQIMITTNGIASRHYEGSTWSAWKKVLFS